MLNGITGLTQAPVGFLVDAGARVILIAGLALFSLAIGLIGLLPSYPMLLALMVVAGLGNSVFHPADYAILSSAVEQRRMGRAFSIHTFGGHAGFALAPPVIVYLAALFDWRIALALAGAAGLVVSLLLVINGEALHSGTHHGRRTAARSGRRRRPPAAERTDPHGAVVLRHAGGQPRRVHELQRRRNPGAVSGAARRGEPSAHPVSRGQRHRVLAGGWMADRTRSITTWWAAAFSLVALVSALIPELLPPLGITAALFALAGFFSGVVAPSRDMMVRAVTPPGASGKVFGFVTTGFNVGGIAAPLLFGAVLDYGDPGLVFWTVAALSLLTLLVVYAATARAGHQPNAAPPTADRTGSAGHPGAVARFEPSAVDTYLK